MATAGAAVLAGTCGLRGMAAPLLALAFVQAVWIAAVGAARNRQLCRHPWTWCCTIRSAGEHCGMHTVPLGLAIIAGALAGLTSVSGQTALPVWLAWGFLVLTWIAALICVARFVSALILRRWTWGDVDGAWFLVPAVALGSAVATVAVIPPTAGTWAAVLGVLALLAGAVGWVGYWLVAMMAVRRICRCGLGPAPRASWWIAMGCAGLAAAALGKVLGAASWPPLVHVTLTLALFVAAVAALALIVPVAILSIQFLLRRCRFHDLAGWPPTFSTAVFALGCLAAGAATEWGWFRVLGTIGAFATLGLWAATFLWNVSRALHDPSRLLRCGR